MPGLVGIVSTGDTKIDTCLMTAMRDAIRHRDWYKVDDYVDVNRTVSISRVHLNITNTKRQPYLGRSGRVKVFFHGDVYNDEAAGVDPSAFVYQLYEKEGPDFVSFLNGSFIVAIVDEDENIVLLANDRLATKPLFYFKDSEALYFGPEMKSLLLIPSLERKLNYAAVADFLANGHFTREHTLIEGLETLDNATVLNISNGAIARHRYWEYNFEPEGKDLGQRHYQITLAELLRKAVRRRLRTNNTYGILLSGGYDSRGILGCYLEERGNQELRTISWGREEDIPNSDCAIAKELANKLNADHRFYKLTAEEVTDNFHEFVLLGEGLTWYPESYDVFHRIKEQQGVDIVLRGDECFGWQALMVYDEYTMLRALMLGSLRHMTNFGRILRPSYYQLFCELETETSRYTLTRCKAQNLHNRKDFMYQDVRLKYFINSLNYVKTFEIESYTPWLDYEILDFVSRLPVRYRLDKKLYRQTIVEMFPTLFEHVAQTRNDIDWATSFRDSPKLCHLIYRELIEDQSILSEFVDIEKLKDELDGFFAPSPVETNRRRTWKAATTRLRRFSPAAFNFLYRSSYYARKWMGKYRESLPTERLIIRLLILKVWGDVFLNYPVAKKSG